MASASSCSTPEDRFGALANLLVTSIATEPVEVAAFAFCDSAGRILGTRRLVSPSRDAIDLPLRRIVADVVLLDAEQVVMAHNHPS